ncbi:MAG TPA: ABC transporter substrate-binding protein [Bacteroidales bacterium]|nr:ABC transporter substrate-binding protein [Bacteroidales bacterium]HNS46638.1 ABC transporter substrate-binding protein [Bacteroidales bacterium]
MLRLKKTPSIFKGLLWVLLVALILLFTDRHNRHPEPGKGNKTYQNLTVPMLMDDEITPEFKAYVREGLSKGWPVERMRLALIEYSDSPFTEYTEEGIKDGLNRIGLVADQDYLLEIMNAQGDITMLNSIMDVVAVKPFDFVMTTSTPTLQAACRKLPHKTVIFTTVADPVTAGAGTSFTEHRPNMTGISTLSDFEGMVRLVRALMPGMTRVGTLFNPSEVNAVVNKETFESTLASNGLTLVAVPVNAASEIGNAVQSLAAMDIQAICQVIDNITGAAFPQIIRVANDCHLPYFTFDSPQIKDGALAAVARDYHQAGIEGVYLLARVIAGEDPAAIPFQFVSKTDILINKHVAEKSEIKIPAAYQAYLIEVKDHE